MKYVLKNHTPEGVQDCLSDECYNKRSIENNMRDEFFSAGYDEVETPTFEYYDVFHDGIGGVQREHLIKFLDSNGRILALRPELTMQIARMCATKITTFPARLFYVANAFRSENAYYSSQKEFTQAGIELLGERGPEADAEIIALSIAALKRCGLKNFQIDIGQVEFFKGLMESSGLSDDEIEELRVYIDQKNELAVALFLKDRKMKESVHETIISMSTLYGGVDIFERAQSFSENSRCRAAVKNLKAIYKLLEDFGLAEYISIDFGMLQSIDYYSGLIFKGYVSEIGYPILSGGRYDNLIKGFGADIPATGCALGIKRIQIALERQGIVSIIPKIDYVISSDKSERSQAYFQITKLREEGYRVQSAFSLSKDELNSFSEKMNAIPLYYTEVKK